MNGRSPYTCDTPGCTNWKEVITPDGYVCEDCADELAEDYEAEPELVADGGVGWGELSGFQRDIIEIIARLQSEGIDPYGLAVEEELEEYYLDIPHSRLYQNLDSLIDSGFVERGELDGRTNSYTLTAESEMLLEENVRRRAEACGLEVCDADGDHDPQTIDCNCGESFSVDVTNGLVCPNCGRGSEDRGER